jgi:hypothetical protein
MKTTVLTAALATLFRVSLLTTARAADAPPNPVKINRPDFSTDRIWTTTGKSELKARSAVCGLGMVNVAF